MKQVLKIMDQTILACSLMLYPEDCYLAGHDLLEDPWPKATCLLTDSSQRTLHFHLESLFQHSYQSPVNGILVKNVLLSLTSNAAQSVVPDPTLSS